MTTSSTKAPTSKGASNGNGQTPDPLAQAIAYEQAIADEAATIRDDATELTHGLYLQLLPLLRKPIPPGFIKTVGVTDGKPYPSTGVSSVQVQMTRMDNVLTPLWWELVDVYEQDGKLCRATVFVEFADRKVPLTRASWGGMNRGSTIGNLYKGSFTNAAKRAIAMVGPGQEVYLGATDYDPDVSEEAAADQAKADPVAQVETIDGDRVAALTDIAQAWVTKIDDKDEQAKRTKQITRLLRSEGLTGEIKSVTAGFARLTPGMADSVETWIKGQTGGAA